MGKIGEMIDEYYTLRNRHSVVDGWIEKSIEGRLHGNMWTIGTYLLLLILMCILLVLLFGVIAWKLLPLVLLTS